MNKKFKNLLTFLDDEDENTACMAMAELLRYEKDIDKMLWNLQESSDTRVRKRIHQLQSILKLRRHRFRLSKNLSRKRVNIIKALFELQLLWYDLDNMDNLMNIWTEFLKSSSKYGPGTIERLAYFMRKKGFDVAERELTDCDEYCLGVALEEFTGADFILCIIALFVGKKHGLKLKIVEYDGCFALYGQGKLLLPKQQWQIIPVKSHNVKFINPYAIIKLTTLNLFLCALTTQSFRYIYTIGSVLAELESVKTEEFFPFPYNPKAPEPHPTNNSSGS